MIESGDAAPAPDCAIQSVLRSLALVEALAELQPIGLTRLARELGLPKPTVSRILKTLQYAGWVSAHGDPGEVEWAITARAFAVGAQVMNEVDLRELARPIIVELGVATEENIHLSIPDAQSLVLIDKVPSSRPVQTITHIGQRVPIYLTGSGRAFLSRLDPADIRAYLPDSVEENAAEAADLAADLEEVRRLGYAVNPGRWRPDVASIAAPVVNRDGEPIAAISISMPSYRLVPEIREVFGTLVRDKAAELSSKL